MHVLFVERSGASERPEGLSTAGCRLATQAASGCTDQDVYEYRTICVPGTCSGAARLLEATTVLVNDSLNYSLLGRNPAERFQSSGFLFSLQCMKLSAEKVKRAETKRWAGGSGTCVADVRGRPRTRPHGVGVHGGEGRQRHGRQLVDTSHRLQETV